MQDRIVTPASAFDPVIAPYIWLIEDSRQRTLSLLQGLRDVDLTWHPGPADTNSISTVLYHLAAIEADYLCNEMQELADDFPPDIAALFPHDVRDVESRLVVDTRSLDEHLSRLGHVRQRLVEYLGSIDAAEFRRVRSVGLFKPTTPEWVVHHLMQHEAEHRGEIGLVALLCRAQTKS